MSRATFKPSWAKLVAAVNPLAKQYVFSGSVPMTNFEACERVWLLFRNTSGTDCAPNPDQVIFAEQRKAVAALLAARTLETGYKLPHGQDTIVRIVRETVIEYEDAHQQKLRLDLLPKLGSGGFRSLCAPGSYPEGTVCRWHTFYVVKISITEQGASNHPDRLQLFTEGGYDKLLYVGKTTSLKNRDMNRSNGWSRSLSAERDSSTNRSINKACAILLDPSVSGKVMKRGVDWNWQLLYYMYAIAPADAELCDLFEDYLLFRAVLYVRQNPEKGFWVGDQKANRGLVHKTLLCVNSSSTPENALLVATNQCADCSSRIAMHVANTQTHDIENVLKVGQTLDDKGSDHSADVAYIAKVHSSAQRIAIPTPTNKGF